MPTSSKEFFIDPSRCIGCQACVQACSECDTHKGHSMIHLDYIDRARSPQTVPVVCMHCDSPTCAEVCPADAIKRTGGRRGADGPQAALHRLQQLRAGLPVWRAQDEQSRLELMMKCDMCYDRTSVGLKPMCATVCPSQALFFGTREEIEQLRPRSQPVNSFQFGSQDHHQGSHDGSPPRPRAPGGPGGPGI